MESPYNLVAGLDIQKKTVVVVVLQNARPEQDYASGTFGTTQFGLKELAAFLRQHGVTHTRADRLDQHLTGRDEHFWNPEEAVVQSAGRAFLQRALAALPTHCREVLVLRELEEMFYKKTSVVLGVASGTVMSRLSRARVCLRQCMTDLVSANSKKGNE
jgi:RNA polymerase sigma factor (sigma-70 family)